MKASLRSVRIAPKKASLVAKMVRGMPVSDALSSLERTNKRAARIIEEVIKSAVANARNNDNQNPDSLIIKSLVINKAQAYHRGVPMARGRVRRMRKFLSHIDVTLGFGDDVLQPQSTEAKEEPASPAKEVKAKAAKPAKSETTKKAAKPASQTAKKQVQKKRSESADAEPPKEGVTSKEEQASKGRADASSKDVS